MTKEEIAKLFSRVSKVETRVDLGWRCAHCRHNIISTIELCGPIEINTHLLLHLAGQGSIRYEPVWNKYSGSYSDNYVFSYGGGTTTIESIFCGVNCLVNFFFEHQHDMVELITQ